MTDLAASAPATATTLRYSYSAFELSELQAEVNEAQRAYDLAFGIEHGPSIDRRAARLAAAIAARDLAVTYLDQPATFWVGQVLRLGTSLVRVLRVSQRSVEVERGVAGSASTAHAAGTEFVWVPAIERMTFEVVIDGNGADIETGEKAPVLIPVDGQLERIRLLADQAGSAVVDIVRSTFTDPPGGGTSIAGAIKPELDAEARYEDTELEGWTRDLVADDVLVPVVEELTGIERLTLVLTVVL